MRTCLKLRRDVKRGEVRWIEKVGEREREKERENKHSWFKKEKQEEVEKKKLGTWKMERVSSLASHSTLYNQGKQFSNIIEREVENNMEELSYYKATMLSFCYV